MKALFYTVLKKCGSDVLILIAIFFLLVSLINKDMCGFIASIIGMFAGICFVLLSRYVRQIEQASLIHETPKDGIYLIAHLGDAKSVLSQDEMNDFLRLFYLVDKNRGEGVRVIKSF